MPCFPLLPVTSIVDSKEISEPIVQDSSVMDMIWPMYKYNAQHTGRSPYNTSDNPGGERWKYFFDSSADVFRPVIDDHGTLYIGSDFEGLYAINPDGTTKWQRSLEGENSIFQVALGHNARAERCE